MTQPQAPALVPELLVTNTAASLEFWCGLCGFEIAYQREHEGFAYLVRGSAHVMLEQAGVGRNWVTAELSRPFGRGINFQIAVNDIDDLESILRNLRAAGRPLFMEPESKTYPVGDQPVEVRQFLVTDPDGYLLRFQARS